MTATGFNFFRSPLVSILISASIFCSSAIAVAAPALECDRDKKIFAEAKSLLQADQNLLSSFHFSQLRVAACDATVASRSWFGYSLAMVNLKENREAIRSIDEGIRSPLVSANDKKALRMLKTSIDPQSAQFLDSEQKKRWDLWKAKEDSESFKQQVKQSLFESNRPQLSTYEDRIQNAPRKSATLAGIASALIPGAGQAYVGNWQTAALAFVINSAVLAATLDFNRKDMPAATIAGAGVFSITYIGNIVSAAQSANEFNRAARSEPESEMKTLLLPELNF